MRAHGDAEAAGVIQPREVHAGERAEGEHRAVERLAVRAEVMGAGVGPVASLTVCTCTLTGQSIIAIMSTISLKLTVTS